MDSLSSQNRLEMAGRALQAFDIQPVAVTFLQHSENITFRVETIDDKFLLRLHTPATPAFGDHGANQAAVNSEMVWLEALRNSEFPVPAPIKTRNGEFLTQVDGLNATLLKWQTGKVLTREAETEETAAQIGALVGRLHQQASRWQLPKGFTRPRRDAAYFENAMLSLWPAVEDGRISSRDYSTLQTSLTWLIGEFHNMDQFHNSWGLLHGDLHRGNFLLQRGKIKLIDFSMSGFGHYAYDLGTCLSNIRTTFHPIFLEHYRRFFFLPDGHERLIEGYFLASYVVTFSLWLYDQPSQEALVQRVPLIAQEYAARFNREEHFWFDKNG